MIPAIAAERRLRQRRAMRMGAAVVTSLASLDFRRPLSLLGLRSN